MDDEPDYTKEQYRRLLSESKARIAALLEENKQLTKEDTEKITHLEIAIASRDGEIIDLKKELRKRWERIEELNKEVESLTKNQINSEVIVNVSELVGERNKALEKIKKLSKALEFYSDKDNLEQFVEFLLFNEAGEPTLDWKWNMQDGITKIAEEALK